MSYKAEYYDKAFKEVTFSAQPAAWDTNLFQVMMSMDSLDVTKCEAPSEHKAIVLDEGEARWLVEMLQQWLKDKETNNGG